MTGLHALLLVFILVSAIAAIVLAVLLSRAKTDAAQSSKKIEILLKHLRDATELTNQLTVRLNKATSAFTLLRDQARGKLAQASQIIDQWKARYGRIAHWEGVQDHVEKSAEIESKLAGLERTVEALRNVVEGYGSKYIVPPPSILDGLARDAAHTDAGQKLKAARERSRQIIRDETASACDYADAQRSKMAANFVLDSFNGKVEVILSGVKSDNIGTLVQKVQDAFVLVNEQGVAFRNARIEPRYLEARIDELRWAALVQRIKQDEREEQRRLKAQMQEEAKAQREFEKIQKEVQHKEEAIERERQLIKAAQEQAVFEQRAQYEAKLREELKRVSEEKRVEYEARFREEMEQQVAARTVEYSDQLADADAKIKALEEQKERAKSMAQQTKKGTVYVISNIGSFGEGVFKIGQTRRLDPMDRIWELGDSSVPFDFDVHALIPTDDAPGLEGVLHDQFIFGQVNKMNWRKEFFRVDLLEIKRVVEKMGLVVHWTMVAAAQEFQETQVLELSFKNDSELRERWIQEQLGVEIDRTEVAIAAGEEGAN